MNNPYLMQQYEQNLQNIMMDAQNRINKLHSQQTPQTPITQNFQIAPNQQSGIMYKNSIEDVKKELVFTDTLFVDKDFTNLWVKNASGDVKTYKLDPVIEKDEKDLKIDELMAKIEALESEMKVNEPAANVDEHVDKPITVKKSAGNVNGKSSNK